MWRRLDTWWEERSQRRGGRRLCQLLGEAKYHAQYTVAFGLSAQVAAADVTEQLWGGRRGGHQTGRVRSEWRWCGTQRV